MNRIELKRKKLIKINESYYLPINKSFIVNEYINPNKIMDFDVVFEESAENETKEWNTWKPVL